MGKLGTKICCVGLASLMVMGLTGCKDRTVNSSVEQPTDFTDETPTTEDEPTIFDKIIEGSLVGDSIALYDITSGYEKEGYTMDSAAGYADNDVAILYSGSSDSLIAAYNISNGKESKKIELKDTVVSTDSVFTVVTDEFAYVYDEKNSTFYYINIKAEKYEAVAVDFKPDTYIVTNGGDNILYTLKNDCNIYQYIKETGNSVSIYDASDEVDDIALVYDEMDGDTIIADVLSEEYNGYVTISVELQSLTKMTEVTGSLYYTGDEYIYTSKDYDKSVCVYNEQKPRIESTFRLEEADELKDLTLYEGAPYLMSKVKKNDGLLIRFYDVNQGIMNNYVTLPAEYEFINASYIQVNKELCIQARDNSNHLAVFIWDIEAVTDVIS